MTGNKKTGFITAYKAYWKNGFNFHDRTSCAGYWKVVLINAVIGASLFAFMFISIQNSSGGSSGLSIYPGTGIMLFVAWPVLNIIPGIALTVRRLHDTGRSGFFYLVIFIPVAGSLILILFLSSGTRQPPKNRFYYLPQV